MLKKGDKVRFREPSLGRTFVVLKIRGKWVTIGRVWGGKIHYECETPVYNLERVEEAS